MLRMVWHFNLFCYVSLVFSMCHNLFEIYISFAGEHKRTIQPATHSLFPNFFSFIPSKHLTLNCFPFICYCVSVFVCVFIFWELGQQINETHSFFVNISYCHFLIARYFSNTNGKKFFKAYFNKISYLSCWF